MTGNSKDRLRTRGSHELRVCWPASRSEFIRMMAVIVGLVPLVAGAAQPELQVLVPPSAFHGVHGMDFGAGGELYASDILGMTVHRVDIASGAVETAVGPPYGEADDVKVGSDGTIYFNSDENTAIYKLVLH